MGMGNASVPLAGSSGSGDNLEAEHVVVKRDRRGHVENLQQRREALNLNGDVPPPI
jgi:hypothetical protein